MHIAIDYETTSPKRGGKFSPHEAEVVGYSLSKQAREAIYIGGKPDPTLFSGDVSWVAHNAKFEILKTWDCGGDLGEPDCTMLMAYLLRYPSIGLKPLTRQLLGIDPISYKEVTGGRDMGELSPEEILEYGAADSDHTIRLFQRFWGELESSNLLDLYTNVERPLIPILAAAEQRGVCVDRDRAGEVGFYFRVIASAARERLIAEGYVPESMNLNSGDQLGQFLLDEGAPITAYTEAKHLPKTDRNSLEELKGWNTPLIEGILRYKELLKLSQFPTKFRVLAIDGVVHGKINQAGHYESDLDETAGAAPATGRVSMSDPNLTQIPHHGRGRGKEYGEYGRRIRQCLVSRSGYVFVAADVSQQEPRVAAFVAPEPTLLAEFKAGIHPYAGVGESIYGRAIDKRLDEPQWHTAKTFFLALAYGADWSKLLEIDPSMSEAQARQGHAAATEKYRGFEPFRDRLRLELWDKGFATDWFGRRRYFPGIYSGDKQTFEEAVRQAVNFKLAQGPAATVTKIGILRMDGNIKEREIDAHFVIPIHDEIIWEVRLSELDLFLPLIPPLMDGIMEETKFPLEIQVGYNIGDLQEVA